MNQYTWELGVDWNAIETDGLSYLRQGLVNQGPPAALASPIMAPGDTIRFRIFDVTSSPQIEEVRDFHIDTTAADNGQSESDPLSTRRPAVAPDSGTFESTAFQGSFPAWTSGEVTVRETLGRFLLTFHVHADGPAGSSFRRFVHDPEMIVGPNM